ncbi:ArsR/SmtB family transcription factor [Nocardioides dongkuii]|uniref:ArsR/SmtB family transcription factor n=1 Tax=Nocardioides dongkuii TaxID=2760089 RepID=UPI0015F7F6D8|nr:metalloregulator ArsR/SmtB family transcription factor [Nocardioides dongkuii]
MDVFGVLADPLRRSLLERLAAGPSRVVDLAAAYDVSRPAISKHLRLLTDAGLVTATDRGRERHYALRPDGLGPVRRLLDVLTPAPAGPGAVMAQALDALDTEVRRTVRDRRAAEAPGVPARSEEESA